MNLDLKEKIFLVTGASKGIGRAIAKGLLQEGAKVAVLARKEFGVNKVVSEFANEFDGKRIIGLVGDCKDSQSLSDRISELDRNWGGLDLSLIHI